MRKLYSRHMHSNYPRAPSQLGFSLVEVLIVVVLLAVTIPALLSAFTATYVTVREARLLEMANYIGQLGIEEAISDPDYMDYAFREVPEFPGFLIASSSYSQGGNTQITVTVRYRSFIGKMRDQKVVTVARGSVERDE